jgi:hypothetical protein
MPGNYMPSASEMEDMGPMMSNREPPPASKDAGSVDEQAETESASTAIVPVSVLGGNVREGQTVTVRVGKIHGNEAEITPVSEGEEESSENGSNQPSPDQELDSMSAGE